MKQTEFNISLMIPESYGWHGVFFFIYVSLLFPSCVNECDPVGASWCDGDVQKRCVQGNIRDDGAGNVISQTDCSSWDSSCMETTDKEGNTRADCVLSTKKCPADMESICVDNSIGTCDETGYPVMHIPLGDCSGRCAPEETCDNVCAESTTAKKALCAYLPDPCDTRGEYMCVDKRADIRLECDEGVWKVRECSYGEACTDVDGGAVCR